MKDMANATQPLYKFEVNQFLDCSSTTMCILNKSVATMCSLKLSNDYALLIFSI